MVHFLLQPPIFPPEAMVHPCSFQKLEEVTGQISLRKEMEECLERGKGFSLIRDALQASSQKLWRKEVMD
jgi:hypothetical protein